MSWKLVVALTVVGITPVSAQRHGRIEVPRIQVDLPTINVRVPAVSVNVPAISFDLPRIQIDLPDFGREIERAIRDATRDIEHEWDRDHDYRPGNTGDVSRVRRLQREWRRAVRNADETGDWSQADALARELTRAADRLKR